MRFGRAVASARHLLERSAVADRDPASPAPDVTLALNDVQAIRYARAAHSQAVRNLVVLRQDLVAGDTVVVDKQPAREACVQSMPAMRFTVLAHVNGNEDHVLP